MRSKRSLHPVLPLLLLAVPARGGGHEEPPHYTRPPFVVPGLEESVEQFALSSDRHLDAVAVRLGGASGRVLGILNDGRGLPSNWTLPQRISDDTSAARLLNEDSCQVFEDRAYFTWLDDRTGAASTRVHFNRYDQGTDTWLPAPVALPDSTLPAGSDVVDWRMVVERGTNGQPYVVVAMVVEASGQDFVFVSISANGGGSFAAPVRAHASSASPGDVGAVACDLRFGELHVAWTDDRAGTLDVHYRLGLLTFTGAPLWFGPETAVSTGLGSSAVGPLVLETSAEAAWSGSDQKYVGIAYLQDDGDGTTNLHLATSSDDGLSFSDLLVLETAQPGVEVTSFDFEIPGDTFVLTWEDDSLGTAQVFRSTSADGTGLDPAVQMSAIEETSNSGARPRISPSFGTPDGACIVFLETGALGPEVHTAFSDQFLGGGFHDEEYPRVSNAQGDGSGHDVSPPDVAYNETYYNYLVAWREEIVPGGGEYRLVIGGYRPPFVVIEGWHPGSSALSFLVPHVPFQDTFGFVLIAFQPPTEGPGTLLYDGRKTGFVFDGLTASWLNNSFAFAVFRNDSANEGGETFPMPLPPLASAPAITAVAASWGPFGDLHVLTEPFREPFGPPAP